MLSDYGIETAGINLNSQKEKLNTLEPPFIAHFGNDFVVVDKLYQDDIRFTWKDKAIHTSIDQFNENWSGIVLLAETNEKSIEPDYKEHWKKELFDKLEKLLLLAALSAMTVLVFISQQIFHNPG